MKTRNSVKQEKQLGTSVKNKGKKFRKQAKIDAIISLANGCLNLTSVLSLLNSKEFIIKEFWFLKDLEQGKPHYKTFVEFKNSPVVFKLEAYPGIVTMTTSDLSNYKLKHIEMTDKILPALQLQMMKLLRLETYQYKMSELALHEIYPISINFSQEVQ